MVRLLIEGANIIVRQCDNRNIDVRHAWAMPTCKSLIHIGVFFITSLLMASMLRPLQTGISESLTDDDV
jgi:hypothetical protein